jgi:hypothetical protein
MTDCMNGHPETERCRREIAAMEQQDDAPAWLVTLGITDWEYELALLGSRHAAAGGSVRTADTPKDGFPRGLGTG